MWHCTIITLYYTIILVLYHYNLIILRTFIIILPPYCINTPYDCNITNHTVIWYYIITIIYYDHITPILWELLNHSLTEPPQLRCSPLSAPPLAQARRTCHARGAPLQGRGLNGRREGTRRGFHEIHGVKVEFNGICRDSLGLI